MFSVNDFIEEFLLRSLGASSFAKSFFTGSDVENWLVIAVESSALVDCSVFEFFIFRPQR